MVKRMSFVAQLSRLHSWLHCFTGCGRLFSLFGAQFPYLENETSTKVYVSHEIIVRIKCFNMYGVPKIGPGA